MASAAVMTFFAMPTTHVGVFKGDAPNMVDMLVAACEQKPQAGTYSGYGRDLVPCADAWLTEGDTNRLNDAKFAKGSHKHARSGNATAKAPGSPKHKKPATEPKKAAASSLTNRVPSTAIAIPAAPKTAVSPPRRSSVDATGFTCPAVAPSPKPEALPMPTSGLLSRAAARARSPSPDRSAAMAFDSVTAGARKLQFVAA